MRTPCPPQVAGTGRLARMTTVPIADDSIRLGQFLKLADLADSGSDARALLEDGAVSVNGEVELRRGRQLVRGDVVEVDLPTGPISATVG
jgi:ribosome-associated protein